ncbi:MAG: hypothetical protein WBM08_07350 [Prochlorococcaceae cyanobacterium]
MTIGQVIVIGIFNFNLFRILLAVGVVRVVLRGEHIQGRLNTIDKMLIAWGTWVLLASFFHKFTPGSGPVYALGAVYNALLPYFLLRIWCRNERELRIIIGAIVILLVPISIAMWIEKITVHNPFAIFGGVLETPLIREGSVRASGPFAHPILAGTVGATSLPLMASIWKSRRALAMLGIAACLAMVLASASSGPLMSLVFGIFALSMWWCRRMTRYAMPAIVVVYTLLSFVMPRPPYYLISHIDLTGGSTGWHRSYLIDMFLAHFHEWWAFGTDRTIHWVPNISGPSPEHTDITNAYIAFAILAGLPALLLILAILWRAFTWVGIAVRTRTGVTSREKFIAWCLGSTLFAHVTTSISVVYFDQTQVFFWATISMISSFHSFINHQSLPASAWRRYAVLPAMGPPRPPLRAR